MAAELGCVSILSSSRFSVIMYRSDADFPTTFSFQTLTPICVSHHLLTCPPHPLSSTQIDADEFFEVLSNIHRHSKFLQNKPPQFVPKEDLVAEEVLKVLAPFTIENGGPLIVKKFMYAPERSNVIVHYPGTSDKIVSFVGSHMDTVCEMLRCLVTITAFGMTEMHSFLLRNALTCFSLLPVPFPVSVLSSFSASSSFASSASFYLQVPADPEQWTRDPFTIARDGDRIFGRGVTDCLGHVALLTCVFKKIAQLRPTLERGVAAVLIANEENGEIPGIGIDELEKRGELAFLKNGPVRLARGREVLREGG